MYKFSFRVDCLHLCLSLKCLAKQLYLSRSLRIDGSHLMCLFLNMNKIILEFLLTDLAVIGVRRGNPKFLGGEG